MTPEQTNALLDELGSFSYDPLGFVYWAFPWGEPGELQDQTGPDEWQIKVLTRLGQGLITIEEAILIAVTSGHGVGKSALVAWIVWWAYSTASGTRGVVTANTENQLKTKTWVEIAKWHRLFIAKALFKCTATAIFSVDEELAREWRIDIVPWSERNTEAFAGLHNAGRRILIVFDEASAIPDVIWEVTEGAMTDRDTEIIWIVMGNPTRTSGRFRDCFDGGQFAHRWWQLKVDSRRVKRTNKAQLEKWIEDYGLDSDFVRVRITGEFPKSDANSFIPRKLAEEAAARPSGMGSGPIVIGVDPARFGDDSSVLYARQGLDAKLEPPEVYQGLSVTEVAFRAQSMFYRLNASAVFVDGTGAGGGVVDVLRMLGIPTVDVQFAARADGLLTAGPGVRYGNKRAEIWGAMREFLKTGAIFDTIPAGNISLLDELCMPTYFHNAKAGIMLEPKESVKRRLGKSPDIADALAVTFAQPLHDGLVAGNAVLPPEDYNPFSSEHMNVQ